jgi:hypothetical protein
LIYSISVDGLLIFLGGHLWLWNACQPTVAYLRDPVILIQQHHLIMNQRSDVINVADLPSHLRHYHKWLLVEHILLGCLLHPFIDAQSSTKYCFEVLGSHQLRAYPWSWLVEALVLQRSCH